MEPAFIFDLDGTLIDSVYCHVVAWQDAFAGDGVAVPNWEIHRKIGMGGDLFVPVLLKAHDEAADEARIDRLKQRHEELYDSMSDRLRPLPGAGPLLERLIEHGATIAIGTSGSEETAQSNLERLGIDVSSVPIVTADDAGATKPQPDLFFAAAKRLDVDPQECIAIGDSVWDMLAARRARMLGVGLLCGGYGRDELFDAGAFRVYDDPAAMMDRLHEFGLPV